MDKTLFKREVEAECEQIDLSIRLLVTKRNKLLQQFKEQCPHEKRYLTIEFVYEEDDYGCRKTSTERSIFCSRCGAKTTLALPQGTNISLKEIRKKLSQDVLGLIGQAYIAQTL